MSGAAEMSQQDVELKVFTEFLQSYNRLTQDCFKHCVNNFSSRKVSPEETSCASKCVDKYLNTTQRISQRFQEYNAAMNESMVPGK